MNSYPHNIYLQKHKKEYTICMFKKPHSKGAQFNRPKDMIEFKVLKVIPNTIYEKGFILRFSKPYTGYMWFNNITPDKKLHYTQVEEDYLLNLVKLNYIERYYDPLKKTKTSKI